MHIEKLKGKVTSEAEYEQIVNDMLRVGAEPPRKQVLAPVTSNALQAPWWVQREHARIQVGLYETTDVTRKLTDNFPWAAVHISKDDPQMVAYTPDAVMGEQDRQLKLSLGKLLLRLYPAATADQVKGVVERHKAEVEATVEFIEGPGIADAYDAGPSSCMAGKTWNLEGHRPTDAYDAPGIRLAVIRDANGVIRYRSLVYEASPTDKRWIRCYPNDGSRQLSGKLERLGYRCGDLGGATLKTIQLKSGAYVVPYLDQNGKMADIYHTTVIVLDGVLRVLTADQRKVVIRVLSDSNMASPNQYGTLRLANTSSAAYQKPDLFTGRLINTLIEGTSPAYKDGVFGVTTEVDCEDYEEVRVALRTSAIVQRGTPTFIYGGLTYLDTPELREGLGMVKLDAGLYPEQQDWVNKSYTCLDTQGRRVLKSDTVRVVAGAGTAPGYLYKAGFDKKTYVRLNDLNGAHLYAAPGVKWERTVSGRKVVEGVHAVTRTWDDKLYFDRDVQTDSVLGISFSYKRREESSPERELYIARRLVASTPARRTWAQHLAVRMSEYHYLDYPYATEGRRYRLLDIGVTLALEDLIEHNLQLWRYVGNAALSSVIRKCVAEIARRVAEAEAIEAPVFLPTAAVTAVAEPQSEPELETV